MPGLLPAPENMPACHKGMPWRGSLYPVMGKAQIGPNSVNKFPVAAGAASTAHTANGSLEKMPVGTMATMLKIALRHGHKKHQAVDLNNIPKTAPSHLEPVRLDV
ncbi:unnamed protein product, partial [Discosporangium mesarthrocarpum]